MNSRPIRVSVLGAGSWGTTLASLAAANADTVLWARNADTTRRGNEEHVNHACLGELPLHPELRATGSLAEAVSDADVAGPRGALARRAWRIEGHRTLLRSWISIISLTNGLEQGSDLRMTQVIDGPHRGRGVPRSAAATAPTSEIHGVR